MTKRQATVLDTNEAPPQLRGDDGSLTWIVRGANFVVAVTRAKRGTRLIRKRQVDESMLFVPPGVTAEVVVSGERLAVEQDSLVILPPGDSAIIVHTEGDVFRIFSSRATDLVSRSANASTYADRPDEVAPLSNWPAPRSGYRARIYTLKDVVSGGGFGRIYRSTNLMVNIFEPYTRSRDQAALSPHSHDDFEQGSLTIIGSFEHYLRTPWGADRTEWRNDLVAKCGSPSIAIIPAGMIHTTAWFGEHGRMIDVFSPPREDFSRRPGWVRNESDYPSPDWI